MRCQGTSPGAGGRQWSVFWPSVLLLILAGLVSCVPAAPGSSPGQPPSGRNGSYTVASMAIRQFPVPQANSGLMRPAVDAHGDIWFGEMNTNRLGRLDPRTGRMDEWTPPHADYGIMAIAIDPQNHIWFAEQNTGLIGELFPTTETFKVFPTTPCTRDHGKSGPQDLVFDQEGRLWFTELSADRIGRLDVTTGALQEYPVPETTPNALAAPYGIAQQGSVWFSEVSGPWLVRLDPRTGAMHWYTLPGAQSGMMEVVTAPDGLIWCAAYLNGNLVQFDPKTGTTHEYAAPTLKAGTSASGIYGLAVGAAGDLWFTDIGDNAIGRLQPATEQLTFYPIPTANSGPFGLVIDQSRRIWFTEGSAAGNAIGMVPATATSAEYIQQRGAYPAFIGHFLEVVEATVTRIVSAHPWSTVEDGAAALLRTIQATGTLRREAPSRLDGARCSPAPWPRARVIRSLRGPGARLPPGPRVPWPQAGGCPPGSHA